MSEQWLKGPPRRPKPQEEVRQSKVFITTSNTTNPEDSTIMPLAESDGTAKVSLYGTDSTSNLDPLRTNSDQQLQVEVVGGSRKCLGSSAPAATTETVLYTVPTGKSAYVHSLWVANRGAIESFRIGVSVGGGALANEDYILYDVSIPATDTLFWASERMLCLTADDEVRVRSSGGNLTYKIFGEEA